MEPLVNKVYTEVGVPENTPAVRIVKSMTEAARYFQVTPETIKRWKLNGMPVEVGGLYDLTRIAAWRVGKKSRQGIEFIHPVVNIEHFKANRANIYAREQAEAIKIQQLIRHYHFTKAQIRDLEKREAIALYDQLRRDQKDKFEQERLERGESTENVAVIVKAIKELKKKRNDKRSQEPSRAESRAG